MTCPDKGWWSSECISQILITRERMPAREDFLAQQPVIPANIGWAILFWMHTTQAAQLDFDLTIHYSANRALIYSLTVAANGTKSNPSALESLMLVDIY